MNERYPGSLDLVVITGMSGAGRTVAVQCFEDLGYYCVDNLPPTLLPKFLELMKETGGKINKIAVVMDLRSKDFFKLLQSVVEDVSNLNWVDSTIFYLDANDTTLVSRYKESRRTHPLAPNAAPLIGITKERQMLEKIKNRASIMVDTTDLSPKHLREKIVGFFSNEDQKGFVLQVLSFGYKHGIPLDADLVFDVRFLTNPFYIKELKPQTGLDSPVYDYVLALSETQVFLQKLTDMLEFMIPLYKKEGKSHLVVAIGCTGGQHRSVSLARYITDYFKEHIPTNILHRDVEKRKGHD